MIGVAAHGESFSARGIAGCVLILAATVIIACVRDEEPDRDGLMQGDEKKQCVIKNILSSKIIKILFKTFYN